MCRKLSSCGFLESPPSGWRTEWSQLAGCYCGSQWSFRVYSLLCDGVAVFVMGMCYWTNESWTCFLTVRCPWHQHQQWEWWQEQSSRAPVDRSMPCWWLLLCTAASSCKEPKGKSEHVWFKKVQIHIGLYLEQENFIVAGLNCATPCTHGACFTAACLQEHGLIRGGQQHSLQKVVAALFFYCSTIAVKYSCQDCRNSAFTSHYLMLKLVSYFESQLGRVKSEREQSCFFNMQEF